MPRVASAFFPFPGYVKNHLNLSYTPDCIICHMSDSGGLPDTLVPFGQAMYTLGNLTPGSSEAEVDAALDTLAAMGIDSDCNKISDIKQLKGGRDPNPPGEYIDMSGKPNPNDEPPGGCTTKATLSPIYGCGARLSPMAPSWEGAAAMAVAISLVLTSRRWPRRRTRPCDHRRRP
jgi:hypothetical protein